MNEKPLLIGRLARLSGVRPDTIRFYERSGLLPKPSRTASGYRVYDDAALKQVRFVRKALPPPSRLRDGKFRHSRANS